MQQLSILLLVVAISGTTFGQKPSVPLRLGINPGDTSTSLIVGQGASDPYNLGNFLVCQGYGTNLSREVWYRYTAPSSGILVLHACSGFVAGTAFANFDLNLAAWRATSGGNLTSPSCSADFIFQSQCANSPYGYSGLLPLQVVVGTTYYIRVNGKLATDEGPYALAADLVGQPAFTLALTGSPGVLNVNLLNGAPDRPYFTAASLDAANFNPQQVGEGWWHGLHISVQELILQIGINSPPYRGMLDPGGSDSLSLPYPPALVGLSFAAVTVQIHPATGAVELATDVETFTF